MRSVRRTAIGAALAAAVALQTGCGSPAYTSSSDPASVTPAGAHLFVSFALKPPGGASSAAASDLRQLTHLANPYAKLAEELLGEGAEHPEYARQIEQWVGDRAGIFFARPPAHLGSPQLGLGAAQLNLGAARLGLGTAQLGLGAAQLGTLVLDVRDLAGARAFLARRDSLQGARASSHRGVTFEVSPTGRAAGIVADYVVIGTRLGVEETIDTAHGSSSLKRSAGLDWSPETLAGVYLEPAPHTGGLLADVHRLWMSATAAKSSLSVQGELTVEDGFAQLLGPGGAHELEQLPGGSWLALGTGRLAATLPRWLELLRGGLGREASSLLGTLGAGGLGRVLGALNSSPATLQTLLGRWAGPAGLYLSGSNLLELQAALVIASSDPRASREAMAQLASLLRRAGAIVERSTLPGTSAAVSVKISGFPAVVYIASGPHQLVIGLGQSSVLGALEPRATLAGSHPYTAAKATLGEGIQPAAIVEFPQLLNLLEAIGVAQSPALAEIVPYLKSLGTLTVGSSKPRKLAPGQSTIDFQATLTLSDAAG